MSARGGAMLLVLALGLGALFIGFAESRTPDLLRVGSEAPAFSLPVLAGEAPLSLDALRGQVVLLNFWATWCKPCENEMPAMERLHRQLSPRGLALLAVSVDDGPEPVAAFRERLDLSFPILLDPDRRVASAYQAYRFPETWLIDAEGVLVARFIGPRDWDAPPYVSRLEALLPAELAPQGRGP